jgi:hypothetical protein
LGIAAIDNTGNPLYYLHFPFPQVITADPARSPRIRESSIPGNFYICGNFNFQSYTIKVDLITGAFINLQWSNWYSSGLKLDANDLIESPYNSNELIVVGRTDANLSPISGSDAFFMRLNSGTGAVNGYSVYNKFCDGDEWFTCIDQAQSTSGGSNGYILGGRSLYPFKATCNSTVTGTSDGFAQWMCKLDPYGSVVWSSLIEPYASASYTTAASFTAYPPLSSDISDVAERFNSNSGQYEYYGVGGINTIPVIGGTWASAPNLVTYKLDDNGSNSLSPNEFHYVAGIGHNSPSPLSDAQLSLIETAGGADDGIQVFGNEDATYKNYYMVKAYFNGESGCHDVNVNMTGVRTGPGYLASPTVSTAVLNNCISGFNLQLNIVNIMPSGYCYNTFLASGSNLKQSELNGISDYDIDQKAYIVYPSPANGLIFIKSKSNQDITNLKIINSLGEIVYFNNYKQNNAVQQIDLEQLKISSGVYQLIVNDFTVHKILYIQE